MKDQYAIVALAVLALRAQATAADILTLDHALALAADNNRSVQSAALDIQKAQDRIAATRTKQFPAMSLYMLGAQQLQSFDFTLEKGVLGSYEGTGPLPSQDVHLKTPLQPTGLIMGRISQPLTSLIRIRRNLDMLRTGESLAHEQTRAERQKTVREVKRLYYTLQQVHSSMRTVRETAKLYEEIEKLTSNYVVQQVALKGDLLDIQARRARTEQAEMHLENQQAAAKEQLNVLLGRDISTEFEVQSIFEASGQDLDLEQARAIALRSRPEFRQTALRQTQAQQDFRTKKAEYIPDVSVEFNNLTFLNWDRFMPTQSMSIGVSLTWEPFDWGRKKHELAEKQRTIEQAKLSKKQAESFVLAEVNDKYRQVRYRRAELRVMRLTQEAAIENLRVVKRRYGVQAVLLKDVLQSQVNLEQSNTDYQQALTNFWNARAEFEHALGEEL